jgi:hypothetical protein
MHCLVIVCLNVFWLFRAPTSLWKRYQQRVRSSLQGSKKALEADSYATQLAAQDSQ